MVDIKKLESLVGMPETAALIEDSEYNIIKNYYKDDNQTSQCTIDAKGKTVKDIIDSLSTCSFSGLTTYDKGMKRNFSSDKEFANKVNDSKYYIIIRNVDIVSRNHGSWNDLIDIIKSMQYNGRVELPDNCLIILTKSDFSIPILELDAYCTQCIK